MRRCNYRMEERERRVSFFLDLLMDSLARLTLVCLRVYNRKQRKLKYNTWRVQKFDHRFSRRFRNSLKTFQLDGFVNLKVGT